MTTQIINRYPKATAPFPDLPFKSTRDGVGQALLTLGEKNHKVVVLTADLSESTRCHWFADRFPDRFLQVGVAEQNMAGLAAGLALGGKVPFMMSYAVFSPGLNWGVIRQSICYSNLPVVIVGGHTGLATGPDGATHQALEDIAIMRVLPNMKVVAPTTAEEAYQATLQATKQSSPVYIRVSKRETEFTESTLGQQLAMGKAQILQDGDDCALIGHGNMVEFLLHAAQKLLKYHITSRVINSPSIKPLDGDTLLKALAETKAIIVAEDHQKIGGLGSAVAELLAQQGFAKPLSIMGVDDRFGQSGSADQLYTAYGLDPDAIVTEVLRLLGK